MHLIVCRFKLKTFSAVFADCEELNADNLLLQRDNSFSGLQAYKNSKLCNILHAYYLATQVPDSAVIVNAVDPG
jgi:NAD(P)-dependent dehydrogenase (short-subunit alcohol dehydrogenase family)